MSASDQIKQRTTALGELIIAEVDEIVAAMPGVSAELGMDLEQALRDHLAAALRMTAETVESGGRPSATGRHLGVVPDPI